MLLVESLNALGSLGAAPSAMVTLYALKPGHTVNLDTFIERKRTSENTASTDADPGD
jgi:hypothetical protein